MNIFSSSANQIKNLKTLLEHKESRYKDMEKEISFRIQDHKRELQFVEKETQMRIDEMQAENQRALDRVELDKEMATQSLRNQVIKVEHEKKTLEKEVTMLRDAFKTLGYDVKDMKDLLGKLVDGLITKDTVVNNHVTHGDIKKG